MLLGLYGAHVIVVASLAEAALLTLVSRSPAYLSEKCAEAQMHARTQVPTVRAPPKGLSRSLRVLVCSKDSCNAHEVFIVGCSCDAS